MKQLLLVTLAVGLAVCQFNQAQTSYQSGKEYVYDYNAQILTGLPQGSKIFSGLKVVCRPKLQFISASTVKLQFTQVRIFKMNDLVNIGNPTSEMLPTEIFTELTGTEYALIHTHIIKPVQFEYTNGHVMNLNTESDDPTWSVNIKRGMLSLLEINMNERQSLSPEIDPHAADNAAKFFTVVEPSIAGECETTYRMTPDMTPEGQAIMKVVKVRNLDRCLDAMPAPKTMAYVLHCKGNCQTTPFQNNGFFTRQSSVRYSLLGSPSQFMILSAIGEGQYSVAPYTETAGRMATFVNQTLVMVNSRDVQTEIAGPRNPQQHGRPLKADIPGLSSSPAVRDAHTSSNEQTLVYEMAKKLLLALNKFTADKVREEAGNAYMEFYWLLHRMNTVTFQRFHQEFGKLSAPNKNIRKLYLDTLPTLGTYPAVEMMISAIKNNEMTPSEASMAFMLFSMVPSPDVFIVKTVADWVNTVETWPTVGLKRSVYLCLGTLAKKMIMTNHTEIMQLHKQQKLVIQLRDQANAKLIRRKLDQKAEKIRDKLHQAQELYSTTKEMIIQTIRKLFQSDNVDDKVLAVKAVGNCGFPEFFTDCEGILKSTSVPYVLKVETLSSLKGMMMTPEKVHKALLPIFFDRKQPDLVRMLSFYTVMKLDAPYPVVEMVAKSLYDEPSYNVGAFVWTYLMESSNRTIACPCIQTLAQNTTLAMRFAKEFKSGMQYTKYMFRQYYNPHLRTAHACETLVMNSLKHFFPESMRFTYYTKMLKRLMPVMESGYFIVGDWSEASARAVPDILSDILKPRRQRSAEENAEEMDSIKRKLNVPERPESAPKGHIYVKIMNQEITYYDIEPNLFHARAAGSSPLDISKVINSFRSMMIPYMYHTMPSDTGLPIWMTCSALAMMRLNGNIQLNPTASPTESSAHRKWTVNLNMKKSMLWQTNGIMHVELPYHRVGTAVRAFMNSYVPMAITMKMDYTKKKYIWTFNNVEPLRINTEARPCTYTMKIPSDPAHFPQPTDIKEIMFVDGNDIKPLMFEYGKKELGHDITISGKRLWTLHDGAPVCPFNGKNKILIQMKPGPIPTVLEGQYVSADSELDNIPVTSQEDSSEWSWRSWLFSSGGTSEGGGQSRQQTEPQPSSAEERWSGRSPEASSWRGRYSDDPSKGFDNLEYVDVTLQTLEDRFRPVTEILPDGKKYGFVLRIAESGRTPTRQMQFSYLWQCSASRLRMLTNFMLRRSAIPEVATQPWQLETHMDHTYPSRQVEPSDLENERYQAEVKQQIRMSVKEDGTTPDWLANLPGLMAKQASKQIQKFGRKGSLKQLIDNVVGHMINKATESDTIELARAVQQQIHILKKVEDVAKQSAQPLKVIYLLPRLYHEVEKMKAVQQNVIAKIEQQDAHIQSPEAALVYYCLIKQKTTIERLEKIFARIRPICPGGEQEKLKQKIMELIGSVKEQKIKQDAKTLAQQSMQQRRSSLEISPLERRVFQALLNAEQQIVSLSKKLTAQIEASSSQAGGRGQEVPVAIITEAKMILEATKSLGNELDEVLQTNARMDPMLKSKVLEVCFLTTIVVKDCNQLVKLAETGPVNELVRDANINQLIYLKKQLFRHAKDIAIRLALCVSLENDSQTGGQLTPQDQSDLKALMKCEIKQMKAVGLISKTPLPYEIQASTSQGISSGEVESWIQRIRKAAALCEEVQNNIRAVVERKEGEGQRTGKPVNPILLKLLLVIYKQSEVADKIYSCAQQCHLQAAASGSGPETSSFEEIRTTCELHRTEALKLGKIVTKIVEKKMVTDAGIERIPEAYRYTSEEPSRLVSLQKSIHMIQSKQLQQEAAVKKMKEGPSSGETYGASESSSSLPVLNILSRAESIQQDIAAVQGKVQQEIERRPQDSSILYVCRQLRDCIQRQIQIMKPVIDKAYQLAQTQANMREPLRKAQELQNQMLQAPSIGERFVVADSTAGSSGERSGLVGGITGVPNQVQLLTTVLYGPDNEEPKKIFIKVFGKKSMSQLLWEARQQSPLEVDPLIRMYRAERQVVNDKMASTYWKLKDELNTYRHVHLMCAYPKDIVPVPVRGFIWNLHETVKYRFYHHAQFMMPDKFNVQNNFEIVSEFKRDSNWVDMLVRTPYETNKFESVRVPWIAHCVCPFVGTTESSITQRAMKSMGVAGQSYPKCEISGNRIKTLDGLQFNIPQVNQPCGSVVAMDCSASSRFIIMSKPVPTGTAVRGTKILTKAYKVEIIPDQTPVRVIVNGQETPVSEQPREIRKDNKILRLKKSGSAVEISWPYISLTVITDGSHTSIEVPLSLYKSKICGLCGNHDTQINNDMAGPMGVQYPEEKSFMSTYLVPNQQCDARAIQAENRVPEIRALAAKKKPIAHIKTVEKQIGQQTKTCFSKVLLKSCPSGTRAAEVSRRPVAFFCVDRASRKVSRYMQMSPSSLKAELASRPTSVTDYVSEPLACVAA